MWNFSFLLHNLALSEPVGNEYIAAVPASDERVASLLAIPAFKHLVTHFADQFGRKRKPSILIATDDVPKRMDAIRDFRNALSIAAICRAWEFQLNSDLAGAMYDYSGYFDLYPYTLSKNNDLLIINSPALMGIDSVEDFRGQTSAELAVGAPRSNWLDERLFQELLAQWTNLYIRRKSSRATSRLFRSLEMAFRASAIPYANRASIDDYGAQISLWVSALEILVWEESKRSSPKAVCNVLGRLPTENRILKRKAYVAFYGKERVTLLQRLCCDMYQARNAFLHGNPITPKTLYPLGQMKKSALTAYAPIVYKAALYAMLKLWPARKGRLKGTTNDFFHWNQFEKAIRSSSPQEAPRRRTVADKKY
ncbi:MAG TPA: hypothetical protein VF928_14025 [Usitatibacteraceae bacterium]